MSKVDLDRQINAVTAFLALGQEKGITGDIEGIKALSATLAWMRSNEDILRLAALIKKDVMVRDMFAQWQDGKISEVRDRIDTARLK